MKRRRSIASPPEDPNRSNERSEIAVVLVRLALMIVGASMLAYALRLYLEGIYPRLPDHAFRWLLASAFLVAIIGCLWGGFREWKKFRRLRRR